jgi:hypothetical protein
MNLVWIIAIITIIVNVATSGPLSISRSTPFWKAFDLRGDGWFPVCGNPTVE